MVHELKIQKIEDSLGIILPEEALQHLGLGEGDTLMLTSTNDGRLHLKVEKPEVIEMLKIGHDIMRRYPNTLKALAD